MSQNRKGNVKSFLQNNRIYFDTIGNPFSILAVVISTIALIFAWQANTIAQLNLQVFREELDLSKAQLRPLFSIYNIYEFDNENNVSGAYVVLENVNPNFHGKFSIKHDEYLLVDCQTNDGVFSRVQVPIYGYYKKIEMTESTSGILAEFRSGENYRKLNDLYNSAIIQSTNHSGHAYPYFDSKIQVEYETIARQKYTDVFTANPHSRSELSFSLLGINSEFSNFDFSNLWSSYLDISQLEGNTTFVWESLSFESITVDKLFELCNF